MLVDGGVGVIVAPVEPVILQRGEAVQAFALRGAGSGAALEVPFAGGGGVEQGPRFRRGWGRGKLVGSGARRPPGGRRDAGATRCGARPGVFAFLEKFGVLVVDAGFEDTEGFFIGAEGYEHWDAVNAVYHGRLLEQRLPRIGAAGALEFETDHHVARFQLRAGEANHYGKLRDFRFPVAVVFLDVFRDGGEDLAAGDFGFPLAKREFVTGNKFECGAFQRAVERLASDLLPPGAGVLRSEEHTS